MGRKTLNKYRSLFSELQMSGAVPTVPALGTAAKVGYHAAYNAAHKLGLSCISREEVTATGYRSAVIRARMNDPDRLVTFRGIAKERGVCVETVYDFFIRNPQLKKEWHVLDRVEVRKERCRLAAARFRRKFPDTPLLRKHLADELKWRLKDLCQYLSAHPELVAELDVVYTYTNYTGKSQGRKPSFS